MQNSQKTHFLAIVYWAEAPIGRQNSQKTHFLAIVYWAEAPIAAENPKFAKNTLFGNCLLGGGSIRQLKSKIHGIYTFPQLLTGRRLALRAHLENASQHFHCKTLTNHTAHPHVTPAHMPAHPHVTPAHPHA